MYKTSEKVNENIDNPGGKLDGASIYGRAVGEKGIWYQGEFILRGLARTQHLPFVAIMAVGGNCACFRLHV